eukprot:TRINITY_DN53731_c0_g1_i1.p3 TRINITY_DN53731_c0_g1~~TRINITY_DN53731_c0_g1_i1.p3  ORF type:complete len:110 (-),score=4.20 TRINITY_DN53731_c0_g1_i1:38-367(-)
MALQYGLPFVRACGLQGPLAPFVSMWAPECILLLYSTGSNDTFPGPCAPCDPERSFETNPDVGRGIGPGGGPGEWDVPVWGPLHIDALGECQGTDRGIRYRSVAAFEDF